ncbi:uncharacterized protein FFNC_07040 [Fusarium fujikuroi]|jgi:homogentisate 1,2-dioxygenase
MLIVP